MAPQVPAYAGRRCAAPFQSPHRPHLWRDGEEGYRCDGAPRERAYCESEREPHGAHLWGPSDCYQCLGIELPSGAVWESEHAIPLKDCPSAYDWCEPGPHVWNAYGEAYRCPGKDSRSRTIAHGTVWAAERIAPPAYVVLNRRAALESAVRIWSRPEAPGGGIVDITDDVLTTADIFEQWLGRP